MKLRPMLAAKTPESLTTLRYPLLASPKIDGVRCMILDPQQFKHQTGQIHYNKKAIAVSRTIKPIPNRAIQFFLDHEDLLGLDGELVVGSPEAPDCMQRTMSGVMTADGCPDFSYLVFDFFNRGNIPFNTVTSALERRVSRYDNVYTVPQILVNTPEELESLEKKIVARGYEGVIVRSPDSPYKLNRSTIREQYLVKIKRFVTEEAIIEGFEPLYHNDNDPTLDERGYTHRTSHKEGKIPSTTHLGAFHCVLQSNRSIRFKVGAGFTDAQRQEYWATRHTLRGAIITFKHFSQTGTKDAPRHPIFVSFRYEEDLDPAVA